MATQYYVAHELARYEARDRAAERHWRFLADQGLLGLAELAPRQQRPRRRPLRWLLSRLAWPGGARRAQA